ncbi:hypothetical protein [Aureliella helgolandensis]|uniref:hypothetical protein n=1 Tax=Aureliella helgolandensis TaxID=2527968 RepID=UPI0011A17E96|nr:hypothetical protein [Aureliella helgolandensis]
MAGSLGPRPPAINAPAWTRLLALAKSRSDVGIGDTIERLLNYIGGKAFKRLHHRYFGKQCGCNSRRYALNRRYPYR